MPCHFTALLVLSVLELGGIGHVRLRHVQAFCTHCRFSVVGHGLAWMLECDKYHNCKSSKYVNTGMNMGNLDVELFERGFKLVDAVSLDRIGSLDC